MNQNKTHHISLLTQMLRIREFEEEVYRQVDKGHIKGTTHVCIGQEGVAVGVCTEKRQGDIVTSTHRGHGHFLASGGDMKRIMAELFGRKDGYCQGKGGTQHMASVKEGFFGNGITGGGLPFASGIALAKKMQKTDHIVFSFFGDGASNQGTFHESLNLASIWKLPIVFLLENNQYAMSSSYQKMTNIECLADRAQAYGMVGMSVYANDVLAMAEVTKKAVEKARTGEPVLIEATTYRLLGHSRNDRCHYRSKAEEKSWAEHCPIKRLKSDLQTKQWLNEQEYEGLQQNVKKEVEEAIIFAKNSDYLEFSSVFEGTFAKDTYYETNRL